MEFYSIYWDTSDKAELTGKPHVELFCKALEESEKLRA